MAVTCEERYAPTSTPARVSCKHCRRDICCGDRYTSMTVVDPSALGGYQNLGNFCHHCMPKSPCEVICMTTTADGAGQNRVRVCTTCKKTLRGRDPIILSGIRAIWLYDHPPLAAYCPEHSPCANGGVL